MKDDLEEYDERTPSVTAVDGHRVTAWIGDETPSRSSTLWIGNIPARIVRIRGKRTVEALVFDPSPISVGDSVRTESIVAGWPTPIPGQTAVADLSFKPGAEEPDDLPDRPVRPLLTQIQAIDEIAPLADGGTNLIIDSGESAASFDGLVDRVSKGPVISATARDPQFDVGYGIRYDTRAEALLAREVAVRWTQKVDGDEVTLVLEGDEDLELDHWTSDLGGATIFARIVVEEALEVLAETLDIGTVDAQLFLRDDGTIDFRRSHSRLADEDSEWPARFHRATEIEDRMSIFGEQELSTEDRDMLQSVKRVDASTLDMT